MKKKLLENRANFPFYNEWKTCKKRKIRGEFHFAFVLWQIWWKSTINWNKFHFYSSFEYCVVKFVENSETSILFMGRKKKREIGKLLKVSSFLNPLITSMNNLPTLWILQMSSHIKLHFNGNLLKTSFIGNFPQNKIIPLYCWLI